MYVDGNECGVCLSLWKLKEKRNELKKNKRDRGIKGSGIEYKKGRATGCEEGAERKETQQEQSEQKMVSCALTLRYKYSLVHFVY